MPKIGYARVSSSSQDLDIQNARPIAAGCEVIRSETASGASRDDRSELATVMEFLRDGDELVVHRLDRIGRSIRDVLNLVHELDARGASLRVLESAVTTAGDMGHIVITVLGMVADMELKFIHDCSASPLMGTATSKDQRHRSAILKLEATSHSAKHLSQHKKYLIYGLRKAPSKPSSSFRGSMSRIFTSNVAPHMTANVLELRQPKARGSTKDGRNPLMTRKFGAWQPQVSPRLRLHVI